MSHKVKIAARLRPRLDGELVDDQLQVVHATSTSSGAADVSGSSNASSAAGSYISVTNPRDPSQVFKFPFSSCYDESSTQEEIFKNDVEPLIDVVYSGITVTIFAYGVTSSGKTHTMQGTKTDVGVIPRVVRAMFEYRDHPSLAGKDVSLSVSYMEIYKDEVYDLFVQREGAPKLPVRENDVGMVFVANLSSVPIESVEEFDRVYTQATKNRSVGATNLNRASSRSHAVLTVEVTMIDHETNTTLMGKINLVDLAGSENNKQTGNDSTRMQESSAINKSLSVLGQVVHALNQGASRIPYRNSKLTRILQDALGGNAVGLLICNLAPGIKFRQDTLNTLNFAVRTKNVENKPVINERDNRPAPKPHFSAHNAPQPVGKLAGASLLQAGTGAGLGNAGVVVGANATFSGGGPGIAGYLPGLGLTEKDIDERISRAVEAEVARRMKEKEREWQEEQRRVMEEAKEAAKEEAKEAEMRRRRESAMEGRDGDMSLPSGVLTPILKKHRDLDDELKMRLLELEKKFERGNKETQLADVLSPVSKKKTGRAYVALARAHSEKGDLNVALELYRKAESYVPDNMKLKERIIEIEWAVKNGREYVPSPKPARQQKQKKASKSKSKLAVQEEVQQAHSDERENEEHGGDAMDVDYRGVSVSLFPTSDAKMTPDANATAAGSGKRGRGRLAIPKVRSKEEFGVELTNHGEKRAFEEDGGEEEMAVGTPATGKRQRVGGEL